MAERNVTFLILAKDFASRVMKDVGDNTDRTAKKLRDLNVIGLGPVATAGAALGPALLPVLGGAVVGTVALGTAMVATGAAAGVLGAVVATTFKEVSDASNKSADLRDKIRLLNQEIADTTGTSKQAAYIKARDKALIEYRARLETLPAPTRAAVMALDGLKTGWQSFVDTNKPVTLGLMTNALGILSRAIPVLQPLFNVAAQYAGYFLNAVGRWSAAGGLQSLVSFLTARAGPAFEHFGGILLSFGAGIGYLLAPFIATTDGIMGGLDKLSLSFAGWAHDSGQAGVERIISYINENGPAIGSLLLGLAGSIGTLAQAAAPLAPISLAIATGLTAIIDATPQPVLTAMIGGFIAWSVALRSAMIITRLAALVGIFAGVVTGLTTAMVGGTLAQEANTAAKVAYSIATGIATVATWAWDAALWAGAAAMAVLTSPIFLVVAAIALFAAGVYLAWQHSETFRSIVTAAFHAVGDAVGWMGGKLSEAWGVIQGWWSATENAFGAVGRAAVALGGWFSTAWGIVQSWYRNTIGFFQALPGRILTELAAFPGQYARLWQFTMERAAYYIGFAIGWTIRQFIELPGHIWSALQSLGGLLWGAITGAWNRATAATAAGYHATLSFFQALPGRARAGLATLGGYVWGQITAAWNRAKAAAGAGANATATFFINLPGRARRALASLWANMSGAFSSAASNAKAWAGRAVTGAISWFSQLPSRARSAVSGVPGAIKGAFAGAATWLLSAGSDIIMGLVHGIGNAIGAAVSEAKRVASSIVSGVKAGLGVNSPSRVMAEQVGRWIPPGISLGLTSAMPALLGHVRSAMGSVTDAAHAEARASFSGSASGSYSAGAQAMPAGVGSGGGTTIVLQVSGALDPMAVGQQLVQILQKWARNNGKTFDLVT